ncbi:MAG: helix-turn-helix domain-containing protein [Prolixibacteraceae bacterium]
MNKQFVTRDDLEQFRTDLLEDIKKLAKEYAGLGSQKWLRSHHVCQILNISPGTLQNLRVNGTLPFTKVGGVIFYDYTDIHDLLKTNKQRKR